MTSELLVIVPSRGRPENIARLLQAWKDTGAEADLEVAVDSDDPSLDEYLSLDVTVTVGMRKGMVGTLNDRARVAATHARYLGFMGDDHRVRTLGWDKTVCAELAAMGTGFVYGNDLFQQAALPTAVFLTSDIVRALGYMVPPDLAHMYADNAWRDWGNAIGRLHYLPEVIVEHVHPQAGKADMDAGYEHVWPLMQRDAYAYAAYKADGRFQADVDKLWGLL